MGPDEGRVQVNFIPQFPRARRVRAVGWIRAMRRDIQESGGSQPHVFEGDDGGYYMTKVVNNPQGSMVLVNEFVGGLLLDWLGVNHPASAIVEIPEDVVEDSPRAQFSSGIPLAVGLAWGSELVDPSYPDVSISNDTLRNYRDIVGTAIYDCWIDQYDRRQWRAKPRTDEPGSYDFVPIDQGFSFGTRRGQRLNWMSAELLKIQN